MDFTTLPNGFKILDVTPEAPGGVVLNENFALDDQKHGEHTAAIDSIQNEVDGHGDAIDSIQLNQSVLSTAIDQKADASALSSLSDDVAAIGNDIGNLIGITDGLASSIDNKLDASALTPYLTIANAAITYAPISHTQAISTITGLQTALDGKANAGDLDAFGNAIASSLTAHATNTSNPHAVTKAQVGLSNVPNLDTTATINAVTAATDSFAVSTIVKRDASGGAAFGAITGSRYTSNATFATPQQAASWGNMLSVGSNFGGYATINAFGQLTATKITTTDGSGIAGITQANVTGLSTALAAKADLAGATFSGNISAPVVNGSNVNGSTQVSAPEIYCDNLIAYAGLQVGGGNFSIDDFGNVTMNGGGATLNVNSGSITGAYQYTGQNGQFDGDVTVSGNTSLNYTYFNGQDIDGVGVLYTGSVWTGDVNTSLVSNYGSELILQQTGDTYGTTRLRLQNRGGVNGAMFEQAGGVDLVDFVFKSLSTQSNIRFEARGGFNFTGTPEFQIGLDGGGNIGVLCVGRSQVAIRQPLSMNSQKITSLATPTNAADAATKAYVDTAVSGVGGGSSGRTKTISVENPQANENVDFFFTASAITATMVVAVMRGGTTNVNFTVKCSTDRSGTGTTVLSGTASSRTTGNTFTSFTTAAIPVDSYVWITTDGTVQDAAGMSITMLYS